MGVSLSCSAMTGITALGINGLKNPVVLFTIPSATAPAAWALATFWTKVQVPRDTMTRAPAAPLGG